ncbi:N-acetylglucosamine-6-phosphate deacetylase [Thermostilla marina]
MVTEIVARPIGGNKPVRLTIDSGHIADARPLETSTDETSLPWVGVGLFDLQINGFGGKEFSSPDLALQDVDRICRAVVASGTTRFLATVTTNAPEIMEHAVATIAEYRRRHRHSAIAGIHLEGPFISPQDGPRGAHPAEYVVPPDQTLYDRLQRAAEGTIRLVTLSPEYPESVSFIRRLTTDGIRVAIGHTAANDSQIRAAAEAGACLSTHLGNGAHPILPRHPNYIWSQLAEDRLTASLITDGFHLPDAVIKVIARVKGHNKTCLVSDLSGMAGCDPGRYRTQLGDIKILANGKIVSGANPALLAAASFPLLVNVFTAARAAEVPLSTAWDWASVVPCRLMGDRPASLTPGAPAELVVFQTAALTDATSAPVQPTVVQVVRPETS